MSKLKLQATDGSAGTVSLKAPASTTGNAEFELTLPGSAGSNGQLLSTNGSGVLTWTDDANAPEGTAVKSTGVTGTTKYLRVDGDNTCSWQPTPITALNNGSANRVVTVGSTTTELDAETKLTFDGATLQMDINNSAQGFAIEATGNFYPQFTFNADRAGENNSVGYLRAQWNDTDVAAIDFVAGADTTNKDDGKIRFQTATSGSGMAERMRIESNGDVKIWDGNLVIGTSGHGIDFSATANSGGSMSNETLSDYEEGSFTPTMLDGNGSNTTINVSGLETYYTRIGNLVHVFWVVEMADTGKSGILQMRSLPFDILRFAVSGTWWLDESSPSAGDAVGGSVYANESNEELKFVYTTNQWQQASTRYLEFGEWANGRPMYGSAIYKTT